MAKIIKIDAGKVFIGSDDGTLNEYPVECCGFTPAVGDIVDVFSNNSSTIITRRASDNITSSNQNVAPGGININLVNSVQNPSETVVSGGNGTKVVSKAVYCLLAFFLGGFGIHKFYAGKTGAGIAYLLFCWTFIPLLLSLIDFIVGLCKKSDSNGMIAV